MNPRLFIKTATLLLALCISTQSFSQAWNTVGNGLPNGPNQFEVMTTTSDTSGVYVVMRENVSSSSSPISLMKWNGLVWSTMPLPSVPPPFIHFYPSDIAKIGNDIFISGYYDFSNSRIFKFDGVAWTTISIPNLIGKITKLAVVNGELICGGNFTANINIDKIMRYDGTTFHNYPALPMYSTIRDMIEVNGELYISGYGSGYTTPLDTTLLKLNASNIWEGPAQFAQGTGGSAYGYELAKYQNQLVVIENDKLYKLNADTLKPIGVTNHVIYNTAEFNNKLYLCGQWVISGFATLSTYDGASITPMNGSPDALFFVEQFNQELFAFSRTQLTYNGFIYNRAFRTDAVSNQARGIAFYDSNNNCVRDSSEAKFKNAIAILDGIFYSNTDTNGQYTFSIAPGSHTIDTIYSPALIHKNLTANCVPITFTIATGQTVTNDLGFNNMVYQDATVKLTANRGWRALYGFTEKYTLEVSNAGANTLSTLNLNIQVPNSLVIDSISVTPSSQVMNLLTFQINNLQPYQTAKYELFAIIDTGMNSLGDSLQWNMWLDPITADLDQSDNADTLHQTVSGAYDPNDKTASAEYILPTTKRIDYHIRFQNTGTDTAYKVVVVDSLNTSLALTNVVINSASHPYNFSVQNNVLVWEFENILLPDSGADYLGSQGYVNFSTGINPALGLGDSVTNDANIYFDFQWPITTNTAKTTIVNNISVLEQNLPERVLEVFPNPARDIIQLINTSQADMQVQITNNSGQLISKFIVKPNEELSFECSHLPAGLYILSSPFESYKILITD